MQDGARFFAYTTWALMISVAIIIFTHRFIQYMDESIWVALLIVYGFGLIYFNFIYSVIKRYIRKVPAPTNLHIVLAVLILVPPVVWVITSANSISQNELLLILFLALSGVLGTIYGNRAGIKARYEYIQKLKQLQKEKFSLKK